MKFTRKEFDAPSTEARATLKGLLTKREEIRARVIDLGCAGTRLAEAQKASPAIAELAALDEREADEMTRWSRCGEGPAPKQDVALRDTLNAELSAARARAKAAEQGSVAIAADITRESAALARLNLPTRIAIVEIIADEIDGRLDEYRAANAALALKRAALERGLAAILEVTLSDSYRQTADTKDVVESRENIPMFQRGAAVKAKLNDLFATPAPDQAAELRISAAWKSLVTGLSADAGAKLEL